MAASTPALPAAFGGPDAVEVAACQLCGSPDGSLRFRDGPFRIMRCGSCGLVYVTPRLRGEALARVYGEDYWQSDNPKARGYADYAREAVLYLKTFLRRMKLVRRWLPPGSRVLDVGCAAGYFLRVLAHEGHEVRGVEPAAAIARDAIRDLGAERIHVGELETAPVEAGFGPRSFDLVTLWDVIEHIPDPQATLRHVRTLLKPGGRLLLETQNVKSLWARLLGRRWHHYKHEEHLYHFDPDTIRRLLADCGFRVEHLGARYAGKYVSFGFIAERAGRLGRLPGLLFAPLALCRWWSIYVNPRDEMIVVARPEPA
jgi:2-polyprenyl-3-methyl-5-hydroxy-6-metoxy-1,4-benzoquinol methylase